MFSRCFVVPLFCALCVTGPVACERGPAPLAPVTGKVLYRGAPLPTGTVVFMPDVTRGGYGPAAHAEIQKDGSYRLRTDGADGAALGWHRITVLAIEPPPIELPKEQFVVPRSLVPEKYRDPELSGLVREVHLGKVNQIDLHLE